MSAVRSLLEVAVRAGQAWQRAPVWSQNDATEVTPVMVPIRSLGPTNRARIASHLLALDAQDRYLRFGYTATDEQIQRYVDRINFDQDEIFGIHNRRLELIAMAHLAYPGSAEHKGCAEFGVSVLAAHLKPGGQALLILSSDGAGDELLASLQAAGFEQQVAARQDLINEILTAYLITR